MNPGRRGSRLPFVLTAVVAFYAGSIQACAAPPPPFRSDQDLSGLVQSATLIVVGKVTDVRPGRTAGEGEARLEFKDARVQVEKRLKGEAPPEIVVELVSQERRIIISPHLGPPYEPGERYVLFLMPGEGGRYVAVPRGRFFLQGGRVGPLDMDEAQFIEKIEALVRAQR